MKDITLITVIGTNSAFRNSGCPLRHDNPDYCGYFQNLTSTHNIVLSQETFDSLPQNSTPYPCRDIYILGDRNIPLNPKSLRAHRIESIDEIIALAQNSEYKTKTFVLADSALYRAFFNEHPEAISQLLIVELNEEFNTGEYFEPPPAMRWPSLLQDGNEKYDRQNNLIYRITMYHTEPL